MPGSIERDINRPSEEEIDRIRAIPPAIASDVMDRLGVMEGAIDPLGTDIQLCGPAVTVDSMVGDNLMVHKAIEVSQPGDVIVVDAKGNVDRAVWGELMTVAADRKGIAGVVIDGAVRDVSENRSSSFPIYCKESVPAGPHKGWGGRINHPLQCGSVCVGPGDVVLGDDDGVVVVPRHELDGVIEAGKKRLEQESEWRRKIEEGQSTIDAIGLREKFTRLDIQE